MRISTGRLLLFAVVFLAVAIPLWLWTQSVVTSFWDTKLPPFLIGVFVALAGALLFLIVQRIRGRPPPDRPSTRRS